MARSANPQRRIDLLSQAVRSCKSFAEILWALGPNRSIDEQAEGTSPLSEAREIRELEDTLHREIQSMLEARNNTLSPMSRLTDDILSMIFLDCCEEENHGAAAQRRSRSPVMPPNAAGLGVNPSFTISSVCRHWRSVALNTASLWTNIELLAPAGRAADIARDHPTRHLSRMRRHVIAPLDELVLNRSKGAHLTVDVELAFKSPYLADVIDCFRTSCSGRVQNLALQTNSYINEEEDPTAATDLRSHLKLFSEIVTMCKASLTKLVIHGTGRSVTGPASMEKELSELFDISLPSLRELFFLGMPSAVTPTFSGLATCRSLTISPVSSMTSSFPMRVCLRLLQACPLLHDLTVVRIHAEAGLDVSTQSICLPFLHKLVVTYPPGNGQFSFPFLVLRAPDLRSLSVTCFVRNQTEPGASAAASASILHMFKSSSFQLDSLFINGLSFDSVGLLASLMPSVRRLGLDFGQDDSRIVGDHPRGTVLEEYQSALAFLAAPEGEHESPSCPQLSHLELGCFAAPSILEPILKVIELRIARNIPVQVLRLRSWARFSDPGMLEATLNLEKKLGCAVEQFRIGNWKYEKVTRGWSLDKTAVSNIPKHSWQ